ncbi:MAG TPA: hypothetical protein VJ437_13190, partial [Acidiferrobacterales bacterium]|nr:hypothetical protein [Acidiferrobacterales bacterium]
MKWLNKLFGGGTIEAGAAAVGKVADVADKAFYTGQERARDDADDVAGARAFAAPGAGGGGWFDGLVDGLNRLVRPGVTVWIFGGISGAWSLPDTTKADPFWLSMFLVVMLFWFGG